MERVPHNLELRPQRIVQFLHRIRHAARLLGAFDWLTIGATNRWNFDGGNGEKGAGRAGDARRLFDDVVVAFRFDIGNRFVERTFNGLLGRRGGFEFDLDVFFGGGRRTSLLDRDRARSWTFNHCIHIVC